MNTALRRFPFQAMGSPCEIQLVAHSRVEARHCFTRLHGEVQRLEKKYSRYLPDSLLSTINASAGQQQGIQLDPETLALLDHARTCHQQSDGLFDVTAGILRQAWDFRSATVPTQATIERLLPRIGFARLQFDGARLIMPAGMELDLGGMVKEYAADSVARLARTLGIDGGLVNLGGDLAVIGPLPGARPWPVAIEHPDRHGHAMAHLDLASGGLASSGDYRRCFVYQGKRYSHLLNPLTGWPCAGLRAVSVCADTCTVAGSLATIAMLKPPADGLAMLEELGLEYVCMSAGGVITRRGFRPDGGDEVHCSKR